ncbi:MAG TPA: MFS transporter [Polyangia bacterium]|nr:MFS transporter [Polyangia bacterium]
MTAPAAAQETPEAPPRPGAGAQFALLLALQFSFGLAFSIFLLLPKILAARLHAGPGGIGLVMSMFAFAGVAAIPFVGARVDRPGRPKLILGGALVMLVGSLGFLAVDRVGALAMVLRAVQGAAYTVVFVTGSAVAADLSPPGRMARTMALFGTSNLITNAVAPLFAEPLIDHVGPWAAYLAAALVSGIAAALATRLAERPAEAREGGDKSARASLWVVLKRGRARRITIAIGLAGVAFNAVFTFSGPMALALGIPRVRGFFVAYTVAVIAVRVLLRDVIDRVGPQRACVAALGLYVVVVAGMCFMPWLGLGPLGAAFGVAHGFLFPSAMALALHDLPGAERGRMLTLANAGLICGGVFSLPLGAIAAHLGYAALFSLSAAGTLGAVALLARWPIAGPRAVP